MHPPGDVVGIGIHTGNALRGYELGRSARDRGAWVVFGGIHATLYPEEALELGGAHSVVKGDGGHRFRPFVAARNIARSVPSGRTDGQRPRQRASDAVIQEIVELRRKGFRFIALADDNFTL